MMVCLENRQSAGLFVEYSSTRRKKERAVSAKSATRDRTGDGTDGKSRRTINARRNGKPAAQTGTSDEERATKRENGTGGTGISGEWRATERENGTGETNTLGGRRATKQENGTEGTETSSG